VTGPLVALADLVLPDVCAGCGAAEGPACGRCLDVLLRPARPSPPDPVPPGIPVPWAVADYTGAARALIVAHKEHARRALARPLGIALARAVAAAVPAASSLLLVPVPSSGSSLRTRGHDPTGRMTAAAAEALSRAGRASAAAPVLALTRGVADQSRLGYAERQTNLAAAMSVTTRGLGRLARLARNLPGSPGLVVVDDIVTTGATVAAAVRALRGADLDIAGIAVVAATRRRGNLPSDRREG